MTRVPGAPAMASQDFDALARTLVTIHWVDAGRATKPKFPRSSRLR
jgi:hypothetical protein